MNAINTPLLQQLLPHLGASLIIAFVVLTVLARLKLSLRAQRIAAGAVFIACLIPLPAYSISHYARVLTGDLSITGFIIFTLAGVSMLTGRDEWSGIRNNVSSAIVLTALLLYPTALGLTYFDLYAHGYYPIVVAPAMMVLFSWLAWFGYLKAALILAAGFVAFALGFLESDNLWDYLIDPVVTIYALTLLIRHRHELTRPTFNQQEVEVFLCLTVVTFLAFAVYLAQVNHNAFRYDFVIEDGFVEWFTVVILFIAMIVCMRRFWILRGKRSKLFLTVTMLLGLFCLFGAGEEISWGQRIFGLETPDYLKERNAQGELGLHNLVIEIDGEEVKLNKLIFGTGLAIMLSIYLFIATPLYRTQAPVTRFFHAIAAPMPRNYQVAGYLFVVTVVELLVDSSKRGEMTEFAGSIIFALNIIYPYNPGLFDPGDARYDTSKRSAPA